MAKPLVMQYDADFQRATKALAAVIARLGYTLKSIDKDNGLITFETGLSLNSLAGQSMSAHMLDAGKFIQITIGGTTKAHGAQMQYFDWGESSNIATKVFKELDSALGPGVLISGTLHITRGKAMVVFAVASLAIALIYLALTAG
jgi:hypothetical protein